MHTHLCLISGQPTPNLVPLLDRSFRPLQAIFLVSPDMREQAEWLKAAVQPSGVKVMMHEINDPWSVEQVREVVLALLAAHGSDEVALNATGGTKPMSIAAYEVFRGLDLPIFYVHPEKDRVIWMHPADRCAFNIEDRVRLPQFLQAHGVEVRAATHTAMPRHHRKLCEDLVAQVSRFSTPFATLNYMAWTAGQTLEAEIPSDKRGWKALADLIDRFADVGLLQRSGRRIIFSDEEARFFVNGGWLEQQIFSLLWEIKKGGDVGIHDLAQGVEVSRSGVCNELDVALLLNNRLHLIECKTKRVQQGGADMLYKLDALTGALGGIKARSLLVSYHPLSKADQRRAHEAKIAICTGNALHGLEGYLRRWIR
ncbi:MAG: DUF1887 family CARF protein [Mariprofundales bacterium]|nr:DUF1887 family CARF protein [Mariprofundales bacterium]